MSDVITAKATESKFKPHPEGQFVAQCVDTIDLGEKVVEFPGQPKYLAQACALVFRTGERNEETGQLIDVSAEFTVSMGEKANLRKFLEQWRGRPYTKEQAKEGVPLHKLAGQHGLITVSHKVSGKGRTYANITACVGIPDLMKEHVKPFPDYTRDEYWAKKKAEYADAARALKADNAAAADEYDGFPPPLGDEDDNLPF